ncbi:MAG: DUF3343 domain-containing protein [Ruminococcaceae bacterium]|nr:DUF3343 domain-containing protein [Oscillospiraceae bacterium]
MYAVVSSQQRAVRLLEKLQNNGIHASIVNTPRQYSSYGCSYSVLFDARDSYRVKQVAEQNSIKIKLFSLK